MDNWERVYAMSFASVYPHYVNKAEGKGRTKEEVDEMYSLADGIHESRASETDREANEHA